MPFFPELPRQIIPNGAVMMDAFEQSRQRGTQNELLNMQMQQRRDEIERDKATQNAMAQYFQGQSGVNPGLTELARANPDAALKLQQHEALMDKAKQEKFRDAVEFGMSLLPMIEPELYPAFRADLVARGVPEHMLPARFESAEQFADWKRRVPGATKQLLDQYGITLKQLEIQDRIAERDRPKFTGGLQKLEDGGFGAFDERKGEIVPIPGGKHATTGDSITLADGTRIDLKGGAGSNKDTGLQKPTMNKVEEDLLNATASMATVTAVENMFKPEYQTLWSRLGAESKGVWSKLGGSLDSESEKELTEFRQAKAAAYRLLADELKAMSGAAVTPQEAERAKGFIPDPGTGLMDGDDPVGIKAKVADFKQFKRRAIARLNYIRKNGMSIKEMERIPLEMVDTFISTRMSQMRDKVASQNPNATPEDIKAQTMKLVAEEFGLVY